jgi:hypothetical protein
MRISITESDLEDQIKYLNLVIKDNFDVDIKAQLNIGAEGARLVTNNGHEFSYRSSKKELFFTTRTIQNILYEIARQQRIKEY